MELLGTDTRPQSEGGPRALLVLYTAAGGGYATDAQLAQDAHRALTAFLEQTRACARAGDVRLLWHRDGEYDLICAAGVRENDHHAARKAGALAYQALKKVNVASITVAGGAGAETAAEGALLASFSYDRLKGKRERCIAVVPERGCAGFDRAVRIVEAQNFCRFLAETPANMMTPSLFVRHVRQHLEGLENTEVHVHGCRWAKKEKMGLLLSVARGSERGLRFLSIRYRGGRDTGVDLALVGKGITFDSGGINLKSSAGIGDMKMDMAGAAAVVSAVGLAARVGARLNIDVHVPLCENMPSGRATKPGDVARASNGKTVEIDNTDAEGRLVLADALLYAQRFAPRYVVDVATLTGAISVALGPVYSGVFSNCDALAAWIVECGARTGDMVWRMPLDERYRQQLDSRVADMKNCGTRHGGACVAAVFLSEFVEEGTKWAHVDIAGVKSDSCFSELYGKGPTGQPVRMLFSLIERLAAGE